MYSSPRLFLWLLILMKAVFISKKVNVIFAEAYVRLVL